MFGRILSLLQKELTVELRRKQTTASIFLFVAIVVYIIYKSFNKMVGMEWNVMIWIVLLFSGINAIAKSFNQESADTKLYYYHLVKGEAFIISKLIYNAVYLAIVFLAVYAGFSFFLGNPVREVNLYAQGAALGILGLATIMTLISAVSSESEGGSSLLISILALPLTIPVVLLLVKIGATAMHLVQDTSVGDDLLMLAGIDLLLIGLTFILFNEVWKN
jgi:heme exporter protein B